MKKYHVGTDELKLMLQQCNYWLSMRENRLLEKEEASAPAKMVEGGVSKIISYYDNRLCYIFTLHRITDPSGKIIHEHVKAAIIEKTHYVAD